MAFTDRKIVLTHSIRQHWANFWANRPDEESIDLIDVLRELEEVTEDAVGFEVRNVRIGMHPDFPTVAFLAVDDQDDADETVFVGMRKVKRALATRDYNAQKAGVAKRGATASVCTIPPLGQPDADSTDDEIANWWQNTLDEARIALAQAKQGANGALARQWEARVSEVKVRLEKAKREAGLIGEGLTTRHADEELQRVMKFVGQMIARETSDDAEAALWDLIEALKANEHRQDSIQTCPTEKV